jgi:hypothetical protein
MLSTALLIALQVSTNTQCTPIGGMINCNSTTYTPAPYVAPQPMTQVDVAGAMRSAQDLRNAQLQQQLLEQQLAASDDGGGSEPKVTGAEAGASASTFQEELARRMGILARQNRCEDAHRLAALAGEVELADASRQLCRF